MRRATALLVAIVSLTIALRGQVEDANALRAASPLTILQLNDVYSTVPIDGAGGLARVAALKQLVTAQGRTPILVMAGDFLSPSVPSTIFQGAQMVAALNSAGLDIATLGNHEFDFGVDVLLDRMREAKWTWVVSNVIDTATNLPIGGAVPYLIRTFGSLRVGFIGLCVTDVGTGRDGVERLRIIEPETAAATYLSILKQEGVDVVVALTHLNYADDRALAERFPEIDVIVGGHEHFPITAVYNRTLISKSGSEAKFVARIDISKRGNEPLERFYELVPITPALTEEPKTAASVKAFEDRIGPELEVAIGRSLAPLDGLTAHVRTSETNLGNLIADAVRAEVDAEVAVINSGGIRGDRLHPQGLITRRMLLEIHPFGNIVCKVAVTGRVLLDALTHGVSNLPVPAGKFPQVSGLTMRIDMKAPPQSRVRDVRVGGEPLNLQRTYAVAIPDFLLLGGDGYTMFAGQDHQVLVTPETGSLLTAALERHITSRGEVVPSSIEGRILIEP